MRGADLEKHAWGLEWFFFLIENIVDSQYCVNFYSTAKCLESLNHRRLNPQLGKLQRGLRKGKENAAWILEKQ